MYEVWLVSPNLFSLNPLWTECIPYTNILEDSNYDFRYVRLYMWFRYAESKLVELFADSGDPDQKLRSTASDLDLHCLPMTFRGLQITMC